MQKLILPINTMRVNAGYQTQAYRDRFGFSHVGYDAISLAGKATVFASGNGNVLFTGFDSVVGNMVAVRYNDVWNHKTKTAQNLIIRYFHLAKISVKTGDALTKDTILGLYGNTGKYSTGAHLHFECDTNTAQPLYTPILDRTSTLLRRAAKDTTISPVELLFVKFSAPDCQSICADSSSFRGNRYAPDACVQLPDYGA